MSTSEDVNAPESSEIIRLEGISKSYRSETVRVDALRDVELTIQEGENLSIMGKSGSGKSTLLNILGCLDRPSKGHYWLGGQDVSRLEDDDLSEIRGNMIGFVFQSFNLIPQLTVLENIQIPLYYSGWPAYESLQRALEMAEKMGLADRGHHRPTQLSGGQQQRVAMARALANDPLLILADEPTGNLDSNTSEEMLNLLDQLSAEGVTLIVVTHDPSVAERSHRYLRLEDGCFVN